jgi:triacylglycerol lipase
MTNALIQRLLTLGMPLLCWTLAWRLWPANPKYALAWMAAPWLITLALLVIQFATLWVVNRSDPTPKASALKHVRAWWGEAGACLRVFHWWQPFRRAALGDNLTTDAGREKQRGVVLLHGFFCNRGFWTPWMKRLQLEQRTFVSVDMEPAFGSIDAYAPAIDKAVRQMQQATGLAPVIVAHSMGGLAARAWLAAYAAEHAGAAPVHRVITLGTPHHGTWLGKFSHTLNGAQMRIGSAWLNALEKNEKKLHKPPFTCFYSNCDNIVFPVSTAKLEGADNRLVLHRGHIDMLNEPKVIDACWALMQ